MGESTAKAKYGYIVEKILQSHGLMTREKPAYQSQVVYVPKNGVVQVYYVPKSKYEFLLESIQRIYPYNGESSRIAITAEEKSPIDSFGYDLLKRWGKTYFEDPEQKKEIYANAQKLGKTSRYPKSENSILFLEEEGFIEKSDLYDVTSSCNMVILLTVEG